LKSVREAELKGPMKISLAILLTFVVFARPASAQDRSQTRSMVISRNGLVAAESPLAAQAGVRILESGGNAVDAAIAANAMMGVVEPMMNGIGGDLFAIVYDKQSDRLYGLNASGWAPEGLTIAYLHKLGLEDMPTRGVHSITVPGAVDGWQKLADKFGKKRLSEDLAAAIKTAQQGFPIPEWTAAYWAGNAQALSSDEEAIKVYLPNGRPPEVGEVFRNPDLAGSLEEIARHGGDAFYRGSIASKILTVMRKYGGTMTAQDLAEYASEWVEPISTTYRNWTVYEMPPNGQGLAALEMLNIMEGFPLGQDGYGLASANTLHVMIEAKKLAYSDLVKYIGDPRGQQLPVSTLLSKSWAAQRAKEIDPKHANCSAAPGALPAGSETTYLSVVDGDGNMVSLIQSNYAEFGSGIVAPGTGFALQNRGGLFNLHPSSPDALAGRKRPLHTIIPAFARKGDIRMAFGIMGGWNQSQAHAQFISHIADFQMNIQAALEAPRFTQTSFTGCDVVVENRFPKETLDALTARGHHINLHGAFTSTVGGGQVVLRDFATGVNYGASDPRKDGEAVAEVPLGP
jgi:gamma-glutamyltranspeptidase / glutathione hydrolase